MEPWGSNILLVEDNLGDARLVQYILDRTPYDFHVHHVSRLSEAVKAILSQQFSLVLLDLSLPDGAGPDSIKEISGVAPQAPIVVLTGFEEEEIALETIKAGAQDFLTKGGIDSSALLRSMRFAMERKRSETQLSYLAHHDQLTGLVNRACFRDRLQRALGRAQRTGEQLALLYLDLDRFKQVNDTLGHEAGDQLLVEFARRLRWSVRSFETVARIGGDEFAVLLEGLKDAEPAQTVAGRILGEASRPVQLGPHVRSIETSIGIALSKSDESLERLLERADEAMYRAKRCGRNTARLWTGELSQAAELSAQDIEQALQRGEFELFYQPRLSLHGSHPIGAEVEIAWNHPRRGLLGPETVIPILRSTGLLVSIGDWMLRQACLQAKKWVKDEGFHVALRILPEQFESEGLVDTVADVLAEARIPTRALVLGFGVAEALHHDEERLRRLMGQLTGLGVRVSLDGFSTGNSVGDIERFPADFVSLDQSLVRSAANLSPTSCTALVSAVVRTARALQRPVLARGVKQEKEQVAMRQLGCHGMQGELAFPSVEGASLTVWLAEQEADQQMSGTS